MVVHHQAIIWTNNYALYTYVWKQISVEFQWNYSNFRTSKTKHHHLFEICIKQIWMHC